MSQKLGQLSSSRGLNSLSSFEEAVLRDDCNAIIVPACDIDKIKAMMLVYDIEKDFIIGYCHPRRLNISMRTVSNTVFNIGLDHRLMPDMEASIRSSMKYSLHIPVNKLVVVGVTHDDELIKSNPLLRQEDTVMYDYIKNSPYDETHSYKTHSYTYNPYDTKFTL